jgi:hypothetical protein
LLGRGGVEVGSIRQVVAFVCRGCDPTYNLSASICLLGVLKALLLLVDKGIDAAKSDAACCRAA